MPNAKNQSMLSAIKEDLEGAGAVWVVDACGLTVKEVEALRNAVRESGACMKVYKNTVMRIALSESELPTLDDMLHGPSAFVFAGSDVAAAAKAVKEFAKSNENLQIKGGLMEGAAVSAWQPLSTVCRVAWLRSQRPLPIRRLRKQASCGIRRAA